MTAPVNIKPKIRTAILISGRGSNMEALIKAAQAPNYPAKISLVLANIPEAPGLQKATDMCIDIEAVDHKDFSSRQAFDQHMHQRLIAKKIELICCAGFMRILSPWLVNQWPNRILNIHPSLLPKHKGLNTHERALKAGDKYHGCSVHYVNEELDSGHIIMQAQTHITPTDTVDSLAAKVLQLEHPLYIKALEQVASTLLHQQT